MRYQAIATNGNVLLVTTLEYQDTQESIFRTLFFELGRERKQKWMEMQLDRKSN